MKTKSKKVEIFKIVCKDIALELDLEAVQQFRWNWIGKFNWVTKQSVTLI